jgi:hypothetical protein
MKIYNIIRSLAKTSLLVFVAFGTISCDSLFDDMPTDKLTDEKIWSSDILLDEYTIQWYNGMSKGWNTMISTSSFLNMKYMSYTCPALYSDQLTYGISRWVNSGVGEEMASKITTVTLYARNRWRDAYQQIQSVNRLLEHEGDLPSSVKDRIIGEAHFFRGFYYLKLLKRYGGPLLIDHTYDPLNSDERFPRASYEEMVDFIAKEADLAAQALPLAHDNRNEGRVTKGAALMLKASAYFWVGSPQFQNKSEDYYGFKDDRSKEYMTKAIEVFKEIEGLGQYQLMEVVGSDESTIAENYHDLFLQHNNKESILEYQHGTSKLTAEGAHTLDQDGMPPSLTGTTCAYCPTQNHVDDYGMREGYVYNENDPYVGRDYRFYANILYDGSVFRDSVMLLHYNLVNGKLVAANGLTKYGTSRNNGFTRTGYYMRKFMDPSTRYPYNDNEGSNQDYPIWRYAEVLLDHAEAAYRTGDAQTALSLINQIRARVHMQGLTSIDLESILKERRIELAFEESSYWDEIRLGTAQNDLNGATNPLKLMKIVIDESGNKTYTIEAMENQEGERAFRDYQYYYPIPWDEVRFQGIEQNTGWIESE